MCTCLEPRFDVVTIKGMRHSEFCCACGLPGDRDVVSGDGVEKNPAIVAVPRVLEHKTTHLFDLVNAVKDWTPEQIQEFANSGETPDEAKRREWARIVCKSLKKAASHYYVRTDIAQAVSRGGIVGKRIDAVVFDHSLLMWTSASETAESTTWTSWSPVERNRQAAGAHQLYERTVNSLDLPAPWDAVLGRRGLNTSVTEELEPTILAPSLVGCLRVLWDRLGGGIWPANYNPIGCGRLVDMAQEVTELAIDRLATQDARTARQLLLLSRAIATLEWMVDAGYQSGVPAFSGIRSLLEAFDVLARREKVSTIGAMLGCKICTPNRPLNSWPIAERYIRVGNTVWTVADTTEEIQRIVYDLRAWRARRHENTDNLRVILVTNEAARLWRMDAAQYAIYPVDVAYWEAAFQVQLTPPEVPKNSSDMALALAMGFFASETTHHRFKTREPLVEGDVVHSSPLATAALQASVADDGFRGDRDVWAKAYERALNRVDVLMPGTDLERVPKDVADKAIADAQARVTVDRTCHGTLSPAYAHAPGSLDAYAIGQAPGERWPHPMGEFDEGLTPKPWRR